MSRRSVPLVVSEKIAEKLRREAGEHGLTSEEHILELITTASRTATELHKEVARDDVNRQTATIGGRVRGNLSEYS